MSTCNLLSRAGLEIDLALRDASIKHDIVFAKLGVPDSLIKNIILEGFDNVQRGEEADFFPKYVHRLWLTDPDAPNMPHAPYMENVSKQLALIKSDSEFIFWHNSELVVDCVKKVVNNSKLKFVNISKINFSQSLRYKVDVAIDSRKFVLAGDIVKYSILYFYGGIYADMGLMFNDDIISLVRRSDISMFLDGGLFFQPAFMAALPRCDILYIWMKILENPELLSSLLFDFDFKFSAGSEIWMHGGVFFTVVLLCFIKHNSKLLTIIPNKGLLHCESQASWYQEGKFGNATIHTTNVELIDVQLHRSLALYLNNNHQLSLPTVRHKILNTMNLEYKIN